jgi:hypothetical protein
MGDWLAGHVEGQPRDISRGQVCAGRRTCDAEATILLERALRRLGTSDSLHSRGLVDHSPPGYGHLPAFLDHRACQGRLDHRLGESPSPLLPDARVGDRILSIDGDRRAERTGLAPFLPFLRPGGSLRVNVVRAGADVKKLFHTDGSAFQQLVGNGFATVLPKSEARRQNRYSLITAVAPDGAAAVCI